MMFLLRLAFIAITVELTDWRCFLFHGCAPVEPLYPSRDTYWLCSCGNRWVSVLHDGCYSPHPDTNWVRTGQWTKRSPSPSKLVEDVDDREVAGHRLREIKAAPQSVVQGDALAGMMNQWES